MKGLRRCKRLFNHELLGDSSQENKGEALQTLVDADDDDEEDVDNDHARLRKCATEGACSLTDLNRLALKPGLTANELADGFWNLQGRLEEDDPKHNEPKDTFVKNIILGKNLEVFLEVSKSLPFGKGMIRQLIFAAVRVGDEDAVVRLISMLHSQGYKQLRELLFSALYIDLPNGAPHSGFRGLVKEIMRLKISGAYHGPVTSHSCESFNACFSVYSCSRQALTAIDEVLGPEMWEVVRCDRSVAISLGHRDAFDMTKLVRNGALEYLLRRNAIVLTPELCNVISQVAMTAPRTSPDISNPYILSFIDFYNDTLLHVINAMAKKKVEPVPLSSYAQRVGTRIREYYPSIAVPSLEVDGFLDWIESHLSLRDSTECLQTEELILVYMRTGAVDRLHSLLELLVPAESSCTMREDGLLHEPRPPLHIVKKRAEMVLDAICEQGSNSRLESVALPLQHYLFHELQLDIEQVCYYCKFCVIYLGPTSPPTLVDKVLQMVHASFPKLDIDMWKELFKQGVYPVPVYYGDRDRESVQSRDTFRESLRCPHVNVHLVCVKNLSKGQDHETLEYLRPWYRVCSTMLSEETKFSMHEAARWSWRSDCRAQAMVEADMIRISDELLVEGGRRIKKKSVGLCHEYQSKNLFPLYLEWYAYTKDQDFRRELQAVLFATACELNRISEAKRVLLDMLQPPSGQDPWVQVSSSRAYFLTIAACTGNLPFVKWVFSQIQAAFPLEPSGELKDLGEVSGPDRTKIVRRNHELTMPAWLDFMMVIIHVEGVKRYAGMRKEVHLPRDPLLYLTDHVLDPPCPKHLMETCLLLARADPLAVLPLIFRIIIIKQVEIEVWTWGDTRGFYDSFYGSFYDDYSFGVRYEGYMQPGSNPAWAWGPITLVKLIELISDETTGTADTILNAKEQLQRIVADGCRVFSLTKNDDGDSDDTDDDDDGDDDDDDDDDDDE